MSATEKDREYKKAGGVELGACDAALEAAVGRASYVRGTSQRPGLPLPPLRRARSQERGEGG